MGLLHNFVNWGIQVMDNTETDLHRIGQRLGYMPLSWRRVVMVDKSKDGLLWRVPDPNVPMASSLSRIQAIIVSEYERAMVLKDGMLTDQIILPPGLYDISRTVQVRGQIEIIWVSTKEFQLRWGVGDVLTMDRVTIGASGYYNVVIVDPEMFLRNVAGNEQVYKEAQLFTFAKPSVSSAIRDLMARKTVMDFQLAQQEFQDICREVLQPIFERWGLEFRGLNIETQNIPEEYRQAAQAQTIVRMEKEAQVEGAQADVTLAQLEAQKEYFLAQAKASEFYVIKDAEVENMRRQLSIGMDPLKLKMADALKIYASNPSQGSLVDGHAQIFAQIPGIINSPNSPVPPGQGTTPSTTPVDPNAASMSIAPPGNPTASYAPQPGNLAGLPTFTPTVSSEGLGNSPIPGNVPSAGSTPASETMTREKIEDMLDKLDDRFANGEMTEQTYLMMREKWQKRLGKLS